MALITSLSGAVESDDMHMGVVLPVKDQLHLQLPGTILFLSRKQVDA